MEHIIRLWEHTPPNSQLPWIITVAALGLTIGSFLNVVIYRWGNPEALEQNLGLTRPKGSKCPKCGVSLRWHENIPILSYLIQKGQCKHCKCTISAQYPLVELTYAVLLTLWFLKAESIQELATGAILIATLLATTIIDWQTKIIPNKLIIAGGSLLAVTTLWPPLGPKAPLIGCFGGFTMMLVAAQIGKWCFGKKTIRLKKAIPFIWQTGGLKIQDEGKSLEESELITQEHLFSRKGDILELCGEIEWQQDDRHGKTNEAKIAYCGVRTPREALGENTILTGQLKEITFPREALGMGDVKLVAVIGLALGLQNVATGIAIGAVTALFYIFFLRLLANIRKQNPPELIAFGPWIAIGCLAVLFNS